MFYFRLREVRLRLPAVPPLSPRVVAAPLLPLADEETVATDFVELVELEFDTVVGFDSLVLDLFEGWDSSIEIFSSAENITHTHIVKNKKIALHTK